MLFKILKSIAVVKTLQSIERQTIQSFRVLKTLQIGTKVRTRQYHSVY